MSKTMTLNVRVSGSLGEFVSANVGDDGAYENIIEYVRDLIRRDKERIEGERFNRLKAELKRAFAAPDDSYLALDADPVIHSASGTRVRNSIQAGWRSQVGLQRHGKLFEIEVHGFPKICRWIARSSRLGGQAPFWIERAKAAFVGLGQHGCQSYGHPPFEVCATVSERKP